MQEEKLRALFEEVQGGGCTIEQALQNLKTYPYESLNGFANLDHHRALRTGFPEVIFAVGKTPQQFVGIFQRLMLQNSQVLATRVDAGLYSAVKDHLPEAVYREEARVLYVDRDKDRRKTQGIVVVSAGTSDIPVAEEAALTAEIMGNQVTRIYDVGVAGLHRLIDHLPALQNANVIVVAAGMEGALPSVVGGLVSAPIVALPTSVGYGASFDGLAALLGMLNSCANGVAVVNIDNGFGAGCLAAKINRLANSSEEESAAG
jgi:hypothetical protein